MWFVIFNIELNVGVSKGVFIVIIVIACKVINVTISIPKLLPSFTEYSFRPTMISKDFEILSAISLECSCYPVSWRLSRYSITKIFPSWIPECTDFSRKTRSSFINNIIKLGSTNIQPVFQIQTDDTLVASLIVPTIKRINPRRI
ncbi:MAG: hypothetical protein TQ37_05200 [Candidatus Synechococcus spongiarum 15L]|uniref:Uncharacterized protein n=1 Tax=Candidatus Synechococcus spongiarum 15L TaxID=1608419 RepID=A0A0G8AVC7_9SYNE|nr:MAG: hypothetical protein TQ37_05200 [Candidatus Synechococcus spongiarum 15L]